MKKERVMISLSVNYKEQERNYQQPILLTFSLFSDRIITKNLRNIVAVTTPHNDLITRKYSYVYSVNTIHQGTECLRATAQFVFLLTCIHSSGSHFAFMRANIKYYF